MKRSLRFSVLGTLEVHDDGRRVALGGRRPRLLVATLLLTPSEPRRRDSLIDAVWADATPRDAEHALDNLVSRVRKALGADAIRSEPGGYALVAEPQRIDAVRFEALAAEARAAASPARALELLQEALGLWRGEPFADLADAPALAAEARRLEDARALAVEDRVDAELALGRHRELLPELAALVDAEPLRERRRAQLMLALYRSGRHADALRVYRDAHAYMAAELGLEPGRALRELELQIARHDPALDLAAAPSARRRRRVPVALVAGAVAALALLLERPPEQGVAALQDNGVLFIRGDTPRAAVPTDAAVSALATLGTAVWGPSFATGVAVRVDAGSRAVTQATRVGQGPAALTAANGDLWIADAARDRLVRVDGESGQVVQGIAVGPRPVAVTSGFGSVWVASAGDQTVTRIDARTGDVRRTVALAAVPAALSAGAGGIWIAEPEARRVARLNPRSFTLDVSVMVGGGARSVEAADHAVWVANALDATVSRIDPGSGAVVATTPVEGTPTALSADGDSVWVAVGDRETLLRLGGRSAAEQRRLELPGRPTALARIDGGVAVAVGPRPGERRGGTLRVRTALPVTSLDPNACCVTPPALMGLLYDGLTAPDRTGATPQALVADLAVALPAPASGGTVYTFRLRPGLHYSDGTPVRAGDFRRGFERVLRDHNQGVLTLGSIAAAAGCEPRKPCDLADTVVADDAAGTVSIHLRRTDPQLLHQLAEHVAAPVPRGTPRRVGRRALPGTGPYRVARFVRGRTIVLERNPHFRERSPAAQPAARPDRVIVTLGGEPAEDVLSGAADISLDPPAPDMLARLRTEAPGRLHVHQDVITDWTWLNAEAPPFDDPRVRQAVNLAVDRRAAVAAFGGPEYASATCQLLPPGISGHEPYCPHTRRPSRRGTWRGPDLARARALVRASGTAGMPVTLWTFPDEPYGPTLSRVVVRALRQLGYPTKLRIVEDPLRIEQRRDRLQALAGTGAADRGAAQLLAPLLGCRSFRPARPGDTPYPGALCDERLLRLVERALAAEPADPVSARRLWAAADRRLVDLAVVVPLVNEAAAIVTGPRVGNYAWSPATGPLLGQLWVR